VSPLELVDDRFDKLAQELRAARPIAPAGLRARVVALADAEPVRPRWELRLPPRRLVLGLAAAGVAVSFVAAGLTGLDRSGGTREKAAVPSERTVTTHGAAGAAARQRTFRAATPSTSALKAQPSFELAPHAARLQRYEATLRLRVKDVDALSDATKRAMNLTRALGGYVGSVQYSTRGGKRGGAVLVLRVPIANVQAALAELSGLGTILQQQASVLDVTRRADRESKQIAKLERELGTAGPARAAEIRLKLKTLRAKHARLLRSARLARISLALTTPAREAAAPPGRIERTLDDAGAVLVRELEILLYALVVAGPLLLLGGAGVAAARAQRRRSDRRLLERA
jgi:Domain of unknown function (DUF4349)